ncbi:MAG TPA: diguanylate cyclase [Steroidobacteraceae bacterium]|nr:diguanylate cyclase [Steroidobacteraceae bacterium]
MVSQRHLNLKDLPDSPAAVQLRRRFPWLRFEPALEAQFRTETVRERMGEIRVNIGMAFALVLAFSFLDRLILEGDALLVVNRMELWVMMPLLVVGLAGTYTRVVERSFRLFATLVALLIGLAVVACQVRIYEAGIHLLVPSLILTALYIYFFPALFFYESAIVNVAILAAYLVTSSVLKVPHGDLIYNGFVLLFANMVGASVSYLYETARRTTFLESILLNELVANDGLTGIHNRRMFDEHINVSWQQAIREKRHLALILVDIDCFKPYNDHYGHQKGDECLRSVAATLRRSARRPLDFTARYGGEEFAVVLFSPTRDYVAELTVSIQNSIAALNIDHAASTCSSKLTVSIGVAYLQPDSRRSVQGIIQLADEALYEAKDQGRNCVRFMEEEYSMMDTGAFRSARRN